MGNRTGKISNCDKKQKTQEARPGEGTQTQTQTQCHVDQFQPNTIANENIHVTERSENSNTVSRQDSASASIGSSSDLSVREVQHIICESKNNVYVYNSNNPRVGDSINCYGPVSFVSSSQSNVQIINQQCAPVVHDFGMLLFSSVYSKENHENERKILDIFSGAPALSLLITTVLYFILGIGTEFTNQIRITRRNEWFAKQPKTQLKRMNLPNQVIIAHTESMDTRVSIFDE